MPSTPPKPITTLTVAQLIDRLQQFDPDAVVVVSHTTWVDYGEDGDGVIDWDTDFALAGVSLTPDGRVSITLGADGHTTWGLSGPHGEFVSA